MLIRYSEQDKGLWRTEFSITVSVKDTLPDQLQYDHDDHHLSNRDDDDDTNNDTNIYHPKAWESSD